MREILFRGKRVDNGGWCYGYYLGFGCSIVTTKNEFDSMTITCQVIPESIGQFTGLLDKNGKKIFEGDIYSVPISIVKMYSPHYSQSNFIREVYYIDQQASFQIEHIDWLEEIEVIGNIHDNPELIK